MAGGNKENDVWLSYLLGPGTIFAMLVNGGIILSQLDDEEKEALLSGSDAEYFVAHGRVIKKWVLIRIQDSADIERFIPFIEASYNRAMK